MSFVIYGLIGLMPGDPIDLMITADPKITAMDAAHLRELYGLDESIIKRYVYWLLAAISGDFGFSRLYAQPVLSVMWSAVLNTIILLGSSFALALLIALPLGIVAAMRARSCLDYGINLLAFAGISIPQFWLALMLIIVFAVVLGWLPAGGTAAAAGAEGFWENGRYLILPVISLTIASLGSHTRYMRASMIETLRPGLHSHGARQGIVRMASSNRPRLAQRHDPCGYGDCLGFWVSVLWCTDDRDHF